MTPTVSVALATYNGARYLEAQLSSIAAQTRPPDELIIGDDGSTDRTEALVEAFAERVSFPVRFHRNPFRLGSTANFQAIFERCAGDVIFLSDQDDEWVRTRISRSLSALADHPTAAYVFSDAELMNSKGDRLPGTLWRRAFFDPRATTKFERRRGVDVLLKTNVVTGATMAIRRACLPAALPVPSGWVHDAWLAFTLEAMHGAVPLPDPLIRYRVHEAQQIGVLRISAASIVRLLAKQGAEFYESEAGNYRELARRLHSQVSDAPLCARLEAKAHFLETRAAFRRHPVKTFPALARAALHGDYAHFGLDFKQFGFDLAGAAIDLIYRNARPSK